MKILVTGGTGFIGSHFINHAVEAGHDVYALRRVGAEARIARRQEPKWIEGELSEFCFDSCPVFDSLVHLAAQGVDQREASWETCFQFNVNESLSLWRKAIDAGVGHLVVAGSCFEYGKSGEQYEFIPTNAPLMPTGPYHASKAAATMAASALSHDAGVSVSVLRPFHVYGEGEALWRFWPTLKRAALAGEDFEMTVGEQVRDFVPVEKVADDFLWECEYQDEGGDFRIRNLGLGRPQTLRDFAEQCWKQWGAVGKLKFGSVPYRENEVMRYVPKID